MRFIKFCLFFVCTALAHASNNQSDRNNEIILTQFDNPYATNILHRVKIYDNNILEYKNQQINEQNYYNILRTIMMISSNLLKIIDIQDQNKNKIIVLQNMQEATIELNKTAKRLISDKNSAAFIELAKGIHKMLDDLHEIVSAVCSAFAKKFPDVYNSVIAYTKNTENVPDERTEQTNDSAFVGDNNTADGNGMQLKSDSADHNEKEDAVQNNAENKEITISKKLSEK